MITPVGIFFLSFLSHFLTLKFNFKTNKGIFLTIAIYELVFLSILFGLKFILIDFLGIDIISIFLIFYLPISVIYVLSILIIGIFVIKIARNFYVKEISERKEILPTPHRFLKLHTLICIVFSIILIYLIAFPSREIQRQIAAFLNSPKACSHILPGKLPSERGFLWASSPEPSQIHDECLFRVAKNNSNEQACDFMADEVSNSDYVGISRFKEQCYATVGSLKSIFSAPISPYLFPRKNRPIPPGDLPYLQGCLSSGEAACIFPLATGYSNSEICGKINSIKHKNLCYLRIARDTQDIKECENIISSEIIKTQCYEIIGSPVLFDYQARPPHPSVFEDPKMVDIISRNTLPKQKKGLNEQEIQQIIQNCDIALVERDTCLFNNAVESTDSIFCRSIEKVGRKDLCHLQIAKYSQDIQECENISGSPEYSFKKQCFVFFKKL